MGKWLANLLSLQITSICILQVENNAMEDVHALSMIFLDYSEDGQDEDEEDEDDIRIGHKLDSVATISRLRVQSLNSSKFHIPLCKMLAMPMVRPTL